MCHSVEDYPLERQHQVEQGGAAKSPFESEKLDNLIEEEKYAYYFGQAETKEVNVSLFGQLRTGKSILKQVGNYFFVYSVGFEQFVTMLNPHGKEI